MKTRRIPIRTCVVCRQTSDKKMLLRVVRAPEKDGGGVSLDRTGRSNGRGAYVCASLECIEKAVKQKRFERSLSVPSLPPALAEDLKALARNNLIQTDLADTVPPAAQPTGATVL